MTPAIACYFDFTCGYSYRMWSWFKRLRVLDPSIEVEWMPFVLKEINRSEEEGSFLEGPTTESVAVLSLAAAEALRGQPGTEIFRAELFVAMHEQEERPGRDEVFSIAARCGLDLDDFRTHEAEWIGAVRQSHVGALEQRGVFGTPTLVFEASEAIYLKLNEVPRKDDLSLWESIRWISVRAPEVAELKRPSTSS